MRRILQHFFGDLRLCLLILVLLLLGATFFNPTLPLAGKTFRYIFVFDITQSMNVRDVAAGEQSRLDFAKQAVTAALSEMPCDAEAGLALFTAHRTLLLFYPVNVCQHFDELTKMVDQIDWRMAWAARSEVVKGLHSSLVMAKQVGQEARLVFLTDGHEAPPLHPDFHPVFNKGKPGDVEGIIVGVGEQTPVPIPKLGRDDASADGFWGADEVMQVDKYSVGRAASAGSETLVGVEKIDLQQRIAAGTEHLSALRESHLQALADRTQLFYHHLTSPADLADRLTAADLAGQNIAASDSRWIFGLIALAIIIFLYRPRRAL